jgi:hypothetical protein
MTFGNGGSFDQKTISVLREVLDDAWAALMPEHRATTNQSDLAARILMLAAQGERDPIQLRARAVIGVVSLVASGSEI